MLKVLKRILMLVVLLAGVSLGFVFSNHQNKAYAEDPAMLCKWHTSGKIQCKSGGYIGGVIASINGYADDKYLSPSEIPIIGGPLIAFDPIEWNFMINRAILASCETTEVVVVCDDYWYEPDLSFQAGYPVFDGGNHGDHKKYLHFVSFNPLYAWASDSTKVTNPPGPKGDKYWIPIGNIQDALDAEDPGQCSLKNPGPCKPQNHPRYDGKPLDNEKFLATIRSIIALITLKNQCEKEAPLAFITCPIYEGVINGISKLIGGQNTSGDRQGLLIDFLSISPLKAGDTKSVFAQIIGNIVTIANVFYVVIFLILIFSSSLPFGLDNYTIKKTLPKFIGAVIMTQFSYVICGVIIDFFNLLGTVVPNVIFALRAVSSNPSGAGNSISTGLTTALVFGGGGAVALIATVGWIIIILLAIVALIAMLVAFVYMMLRYMIMYILILLAPIAFASWVLPGTEKFFKTWWKNFIRLNAMFPLITGMLAVAIVLSQVLIGSDTCNGDVCGVSKLVAMVIPIAALLAIPRTLKWTSDGMSFLAGKLLGGAAGKMPGGGKALGGKTAKAAAEKAKAGAKNAANEYRQQKSVDQFGKGNRRTAALLSGNLPNRKGLLKTARQSEAYVQERRNNNRASLKYAAAGQKLDFPAYGQELVKVATGQGSAKLGVKAGDKAMQIAAISEMAGRGDWDMIRNGDPVNGVPSVYQSVDESTFSQGLEPYIGDASAKIPDLVKRSAAGAFDNISADKITQLDGASVQALADHVASSGQNSPAHLNLRKAALLINSNPQLVASFDPKSKAILNGMTFPGSTTPIMNTKIK